VFQRYTLYNVGEIGWLLESIWKGTAHPFRALQSWNWSRNTKGNQPSLELGTYWV